MAVESCIQCILNGNMKIKYKEEVLVVWDGVGSGSCLTLNEGPYRPGFGKYSLKTMDSPRFESLG